MNKPDDAELGSTLAERIASKQRGHLEAERTRTRETFPDITHAIDTIIAHAVKSQGVSEEQARASIKLRWAYTVKDGQPIEVGTIDPETRKECIESLASNEPEPTQQPIKEVYRGKRYQQGHSRR